MKKESGGIRQSAALLAFVLLLSLAGCGRERPQDGSAESPAAAAATQVEVAAATAPPADDAGPEEAEGGTAPATAGTAATAAPEAGAPLPAPAGTDTLQVTFLDVGQGDCAVLRCGSHVMVIDGGAPGKSNVLYSYLKKQGIGHVEYMVATHPDSDHIGGLAGGLNAATAGMLYCTEETGDSSAFRDVEKFAAEQGVTVTVPNAGDTFTLGKARVYVLAPEPGLVLSDNTSLVLRVVFGETSFLFTGDAEIQDEVWLLDQDVPLKSTVLKVGHHGSASSTTEEFLQAVAPEYAVISVGNNPYGHPTEEVLNRLKGYGVKVLRTDEQGPVAFLSDGSSFRIYKGQAAFELGSPEAPARMDGEAIDAAGSSAEGAAEAGRAGGTGGAEAGAASGAAPGAAAGTAERAVPAGVTYIGNANSMKFHLPDCASANKMKEENKVYFTGGRDEVIAQGYTPCGQCHP